MLSPKTHENIRFCGHVIHVFFFFFFFLLKQYQFKFCHVFDEYASQKAVFEYVSLPLVEDLVFGRNGKIFFFLSVKFY